MESLSTEEEECNGDNNKTESTSLFISRVPMGKHVSIGFDITAKNEQFGKLYLLVNKEERSMQFRDYSKFLNFFSLTHEEKKKLAGENSFYGIGDILIMIYDTRITMLKHSGNIELIIFTSEDLEAIRANICIVAGQRLEFEHTELVTKEAIIDIKTELRMESQRKCAACKEMSTKLEVHTCAQISGGRLNSLLKDALSSVDKWPYSKALVEIYERLSDHEEWFKQEFRHSIGWNKRMNEVYKTDSLPAFMKFK